MGDLDNFINHISVQHIRDKSGANTLNLVGARFPAGQIQDGRRVVVDGRLITSLAAGSAMEFAFEIVAKGTMAEGALLEIEKVPVVCYCSACAEEFEPADLVCECTRCARPSVEIRRGRELQLTSLEVS